MHRLGRTCTGGKIMFEKIKSLLAEFNSDVRYNRKMVLYWTKELEKAEDHRNFCWKKLNLYNNRLHELKGGK
jgi:hypothetical protein